LTEEAADDVSRIYTTCPQSKDVAARDYLGRVAEIARWSEWSGAHGMLVYTDNGLVDPWLVAQQVLASTARLRPLVAVQPVYLHPYSVAKMVASLGYLHGRPVDLNMLAGGFRNDLLALGDETAHEDRYERTTEYTRIITGLLRGETVTYEGRWYRVKNLRLTPALPAELMPGLLISGSSPAGLAAAEAIGALAVRYPKPAEEEERDPAPRPAGGTGIRVGIITRGSAEEAWRVAHERFPEDRKGRLTHQLAMKVSDSHWHRDLSGREQGGEDELSPYWLGPFNNGQTFCPYLVGSHERVGAELARYLAAGFETFILDIPPSEEELLETTRAFEASRETTA
jgi:alkanesulfonate monooxygenase